MIHSPPQSPTWGRSNRMTFLEHKYLNISCFKNSTMPGCHQHHAETSVMHSGFPLGPPPSQQRVPSGASLSLFTSFNPLPSSSLHLRPLVCQGFQPGLSAIIGSAQWRKVETVGPEKGLSSWPGLCLKIIKTNPLPTLQRFVS